MITFIIRRCVRTHIIYYYRAHTVAQITMACGASSLKANWLSCVATGSRPLRERYHRVCGVRHLTSAAAADGAWRTRVLLILVYLSRRLMCIETQKKIIMIYYSRRPPHVRRRRRRLACHMAVPNRKNKKHTFPDLLFIEIRACACV